MYAKIVKNANLYDLESNLIRLDTFFYEIKKIKIFLKKNLKKPIFSFLGLNVDQNMTYLYSKCAFWRDLSICTKRNNF